MVTSIVPAYNRILVREVPKEHPIFDAVRPKANIVLADGVDANESRQSKLWEVLAVGKTASEALAGSGFPVGVGDFLIKGNYESGGVCWHESQQYILIQPSDIIGKVVVEVESEQVN